MTWYLSSDRYHWYLSDIYLISIKQEINVDFLISCVVWNISLAMRLCATALSVIHLCSHTEFTFGFHCFKMPGGQKLGAKAEKKLAFCYSSLNWWTDVVEFFLSWFCFVSARWEKSEDFKDFIDFRNQIDIKISRNHDFLQEIMISCIPVKIWCHAEEITSFCYAIQLLFWVDFSKYHCLCCCGCRAATMTVTSMTRK